MTALIFAISLIAGLSKSERTHATHINKSYSFQLSLLLGSLIVTLSLLVWLGREAYGVYALLEEHISHEIIKNDSDIISRIHMVHARIIYGVMLGLVGLTVMWSLVLRILNKWWKEVAVARESLSNRFEEKQNLEKVLKENLERLQEANELTTHLRREEQRQRVLLNTLLDHMPVSIFVKNVADNYNLVLLNKCAEEKFCMVGDRRIGKTDYDYYPKEEADFFRITDEKVMREGKMVEIEAEPITTPKGTFIGHTYKVPIYNEQGEPWLLLGITNDVTADIAARDELKKAKEEAVLLRREDQRQRAFLDTLLDNMPISIFVKDAQDDYRTVLVNKSAEEKFCMSPERVVGKTDYDYFSKAQADGFRAMDESVMASGQMVEIESELVTTPKGTFIAHTYKVPIYDEECKPWLLLGMTEDVTEHVVAREELRMAKEEAEQANHAKSEFLANMSHELRTPLNSILGMASIILDDPDLSSQNKEMFDVSHKAGLTLLAIVNDILDISKIEAKGVVLEEIPFSFDHVLSQICSILKPIASKKGLLLKRQDELPSGLILEGDSHRVERALTNLVGNAIKYTDTGHVEIQTSIEYVAEKRVEVKCHIIDTGIGIPADKLDTIFEKFAQADNSITRRFGGTGLGLAITKHLIELMGGSIKVESAPGLGSVFSFTVFFNVSDEIRTIDEIEKVANGIQNEKRVPVDQARVLVAEDHLMNQLFVRKLLEILGISDFDLAEDGQIAQDLMRKKSL